jgi:hypothetical protein
MGRLLLDITLDNDFMDMTEVTTKKLDKWDFIK